MGAVGREWTGPWAWATVLVSPKRGAKFMGEHGVKTAGTGAMGGPENKKIPSTGEQGPQEIASGNPQVDPITVCLSVWGLL